MTSNELIVKMVFDRWNTLIKNADTLINDLSNEQFQREVSPGKNTGLYLLGHLIAVHDDMIPILNLGEKEYPDLFEMFVKSPDKSTVKKPDIEDLKIIWNNQLKSLNLKFEGITPNEWFEKHNSVSIEDFINEPHRNKLNIISTRSTHLAYHVGQLILLK